MISALGVLVPVLTAMMVCGAIGVSNKPSNNKWLLGFIALGIIFAILLPYSDINPNNFDLVCANDVCKLEERK